MVAKRILRRVLTTPVEEYICAFAIALMAVCVMTQVVLRFLFAAAAPWAEELAVYSMVTGVYFGASLAIKDRAHIRIMILVDKLPDRLRLATVALADLLWLGFMVLLVIQSVSYVSLLFGTDYVSPAMQIQQRWPNSIVPAATVLMIFRLLQVYYLWACDRDRGAPH